MQTHIPDAPNTDASYVSWIVGIGAAVIGGALWLVQFGRRVEELVQSQRVLESAVHELKEEVVELRKLKVAFAKLSARMESDREHELERRLTPVQGVEAVRELTNPRARYPRLPPRDDDNGDES